MNDIPSPALKSQRAPKPASRTRVSERALTVTLKAMQGAGIPVERVCITGGQIEIHCAPIAEETRKANDAGLEKW
jgi:hypothetical protein